MPRIQIRDPTSAVGCAFLETGHRQSGMITGAETAHLNLKTPVIYLDGKLPLVVERTAAELGLRDNQVVQGLLESKPERLRLNLQGLQPGAYIDLPKDLPPGLRLASGDTALFRVQVLANGTIMLRPLQAAPSAPAAPASPSATAAPSLPGRAEQLGFRPPDMNALAQLLKPGVLEGMLRTGQASGPESGALQQWLREHHSREVSFSTRLLANQGWRILDLARWTLWLGCPN